MHSRKSASLVRVNCSCGWFFYNEALKGKTDTELEAEREYEYNKHLEDMARAGF